jgi:hypothetical protein
VTLTPGSGGADALACVTLHSDKVIGACSLKEYIFRFIAYAVAYRFAARQRLQVSHRQRHPDLKFSAARAQRLCIAAVSLEQYFTRPTAYAERKAGKGFRPDS